MVRAAQGTGRPARSSVWLERSAARGARTKDRRGDQPGGLDRARITEAAVRLLDAEGLAGFSMRRLAADLDVTAMSVYWYVDTKDDLLELALDSVFGELTLPAGDLGDQPGRETDERPDGETDRRPDHETDHGTDNDNDHGTDNDNDHDNDHEPDGPTRDEGWQDRLRALASEYRALHVRHPWVSPLTGSYLNIGPRAREFSHAVQRVVRGTGLGPEGQMGAMSAVFQFVYGFGTIEGQFVRRCANAGVSQDDYLRGALSGVAAEPALAESLKGAVGLLSGGGAATVEQMRERDFRWALDLLIAGIEVMADARPVPRPRS